MTALAHTAFEASLRRFINHGNASERDLAQVAFDLYAITAEHPGVVDYVNRKALQALGES